MPNNCPPLAGVCLAPEARQAPAGVPADAAAVYVELISPLFLADSLLRFPDPDWQSTDANVLPPSAEALAITRARIAEFLRREEALILRKAPEVFSVGGEILDFIWAMLAQLPAWWADNDRAIACNSPDGQAQERLEGIRAKRAQECRRRLGEDPFQTLLSLVDRLRTSICQWSDETTVAPASPTPPTHRNQAAVEQGATQQPTDPGAAAVLTGEDKTILAVLSKAGRALFFSEIVREAANLVREKGGASARQAGLETLSETKVKERIPILEVQGLVSRPVGPKGKPTSRKGVGITDKGRLRLQNNSSLTR